MGRTIGAAIGAIIVFLFFFLGISHPRLQQSAPPEVVASAAGH